jgi:hypothetical protein
MDNNSSFGIDIFKNSILNAFDFTIDTNILSNRTVLDRTVDSEDDHDFLLTERYFNATSSEWGSNLEAFNIDQQRMISPYHELGVMGASCFNIPIRSYTANESIYSDEAFQFNEKTTAVYQEITKRLVSLYKKKLEILAIRSLVDKSIQIYNGDAHRILNHSVLNGGRAEAGYTGYTKIFIDEEYIEDQWNIIFQKAYELKRQYDTDDISLIIPDFYAIASAHITSYPGTPFKPGEHGLTTLSVDGSNHFLKCYTSKYVPIFLPNDNEIDDEHAVLTSILLFVRSSVKVLSTPLNIKEINTIGMNPSILGLSGEFKAGASRCARDSVYVFLLPDYDLTASETVTIEKIRRKYKNVYESDFAIENYQLESIVKLGRNIGDEIRDIKDRLDEIQGVNRKA